MRSRTRAVYGILGALMLGVSLVGLLKPALILPAEECTPLTAHLVREQAAGGVSIGLMALWCLFHQRQRRDVHLGLLIFTALFAAIHWLEFVQGRRHIASPLLNSLPFLALLAITPGLQQSSKEE